MSAPIGHKEGAISTPMVEPFRERGRLTAFRGAVDTAVAFGYGDASSGRSASMIALGYAAFKEIVGFPTGIIITTINFGRGLID